MTRLACCDDKASGKLRETIQHRRLTPTDVNVIAALGGLSTHLATSGLLERYRTDRNGRRSKRYFFNYEIEPIGMWYPIGGEPSQYVIASPDADLPGYPSVKVKLPNDIQMDLSPIPDSAPQPQKFHEVVSESEEPDSRHGLSFGEVMNLARRR